MSRHLRQAHNDMHSINLDTMDNNSTYTVGNISGHVVSPANGPGGLYWGLNGTSNTIIADPSLKGNSLSVKGDANFEGEVTIKGKNLTEMFEKIEERLAILHPHPDLEDRWDELKELGKRYKELEQELLEKERVWAILKK